MCIRDRYTSTGTYNSIFTADYIRVSVNHSYELSAQMRSGDGAGGAYNPANRSFAGFEVYDINQVGRSGMEYFTQDTGDQTTLLSDLNPGDLSVELNDASGFYNSTHANNRSLEWYGYREPSTGHVYSDYGFTRNRQNSVYDQNSISGNIITLNSPWAGPALSSGTAVANSRIGYGSYLYALLRNQSVGTDWSTYTLSLIHI